MKKTYADLCLERAEKARYWNCDYDLYQQLNNTEIDHHILNKADVLELSQEDAEFIANARQDVPELAGRLKTACAKLRKAANIFFDDDEIEARIYFNRLADELEAMPEEKE